MESMTRNAGLRCAAVARMTSRLVSVRQSSRPGLRSTRRSSDLTWAADSSPVTYRLPCFSAMASWACSNRVDLPMPGSPPSSTTDPGTSPPPSTRSSSLSPDESLDAADSAGTSARLVTLVEAVPVQLLRPAGPRAAAGLDTFSSSVFQALQSMHWPAHLGELAPHSLHI